MDRNPEFLEQSAWRLADETGSYTIAECQLS